MAKMPYFPFYPSDWLSSPRNSVLSLSQQGAYMRLLSYCWVSGDCSLPDDMEKLKLLSGLHTDELSDVYQLFIAHPSLSGRITNKRLHDEWVKAEQISVKRSQASRKPRKRGANTCLSNDKQVMTYSDSDSDSDSEFRMKKEEERTPYSPPTRGALVVVAVYSPDFERFWEAYPNKVGKKAAWRAWQKANDRPPIEEILQAVSRAQRSVQWQRGYIPNPATWINQGRWLDDYATDGMPRRATSVVDWVMLQGGHV